MSHPQKLSPEAVAEHLRHLPDWSIEAGMLTKKFRFQSFMQGIDFVNKAAAIAEEMDHHPDLYVRFGLITVSLITHGAKGLTALDFEQAARLDALVIDP